MGKLCFHLIRIVEQYDVLFQSCARTQCDMISVCFVQLKPVVYLENFNFQTMNNIDRVDGCKGEEVLLFVLHTVCSQKDHLFSLSDA